MDNGAAESVVGCKSVVVVMVVDVIQLHGVGNNYIGVELGGEILVGDEQDALAVLPGGFGIEFSMGRKFSCLHNCGALPGEEVGATGIGLPAMSACQDVVRMLMINL